MVKLVQIVSNDPVGKTTTYLADDGNTYVLKGDLNARANNPGNISPTGKTARGNYETNFGAIGYLPSSNGPPVAVFPDFESGQAAQVYLWQTPAYQNKTLEQAAKSWAGTPYVNALVNAAGVSKDTLVKDLTPDQLQAITSTQVGQEGSGRLEIADANGNPVPPELASQLGAIRLPPADIPNSSTAVGTELDVGAAPPLPRVRPAPPADLVDMLKQRAAVNMGDTSKPVMDLTSTLGWKKGQPDKATTVGRSVLLPADTIKAAAVSSLDTGLGAMSDPRTSAMLAPRPNPVVAPTLAEARGEQQMQRQTFAPPMVASGQAQAGREAFAGAEPITPEDLARVAADNARTAQILGGRPPSEADVNADLQARLPPRKANSSGSPDDRDLVQVLKDRATIATGGSIKTTSQAKNEPLPAGVRPNVPVIAPAPPQTKTVTNPAYTDWTKTYGTGGANATLQDIHDLRDSATMTAQRSVPPAPPKTITVPYRPLPTPAPLKPAASAPAPTAAPNLFQQFGGFIGDKLQGAGDAIKTNVTQLGDTITKDAPALADQAKDAVIKAIMASPKARGAIIDPLVAKVFTNVPYGSDPATRYGATFAERQVAAQNRERLQQGLPPLPAQQQQQSRTVAPAYVAPKAAPAVVSAPVISKAQQTQNALQAAGILNQFGMMSHMGP